MVLQCRKKKSAPVSVRALCSGLWTVSQDSSGERAEIPGSIPSAQVSASLQGVTA